MASTIIIPPGVPTKYDNTWGAALIGAFVAAVYAPSLFSTPIQLMTVVFSLYGMLIVQIYLLFRRSKDDMPLLRNSVRVLHSSLVIFCTPRLTFNDRSGFYCEGCISFS